MNRTWLAALFLLGVSTIPPSHAAESNCTAADAVTALPAPLSKWAKIVCTPIGQVLTSHQGWVWMEPSEHARVVIPALLGKISDPSVSYFAKVEVTMVKGDEFDQAYAIFHDGFDPSEGKPVAYRVDLTSKAGTTLKMYFFDYISYGWGMACPDNDCHDGSRFMMLDMDHPPQQVATI